LFRAITLLALVSILGLSARGSPSELNRLPLPNSGVFYEGPELGYQEVLQARLSTLCSLNGVADIHMDVVRIMPESDRGMLSGFFTSPSEVERLHDERKARTFVRVTGRWRCNGN